MQEHFQDHFYHHNNHGSFCTIHYCHIHVMILNRWQCRSLKFRTHYTFSSLSYVSLSCVPRPSGWSAQSDARRQKHDRKLQIQIKPQAHKFLFMNGTLLDSGVCVKIICLRQLMVSQTYKMDGGSCWLYESFAFKKTRQSTKAHWWVFAIKETIKVHCGRSRLRPDFTWEINCE